MSLQHMMASFAGAACRVDTFRAWLMSAKEQFFNSPTPPGVLVLGTMSTYNKTDPSIMHLFEKRIQLPLPGSAARAALFMRHLTKLTNSTPPQPHSLTPQDVQVGLTSCTNSRHCSCAAAAAAAVCNMQGCSSQVSCSRCWLWSPAAHHLPRA